MQRCASLLLQPRSLAKVHAAANKDVPRRISCLRGCHIAAIGCASDCQHRGLAKHRIAQQMLLSQVMPCQWRLRLAVELWRGSLIGSTCSQRSRSYP
jgi:hypothetical protein